MFRRNIRITARDWFVIAQITLFCYKRSIEVDFLRKLICTRVQLKQREKLLFWHFLDTFSYKKIAKIEFFEKSKKPFSEEVYLTTFFLQKIICDYVVVVSRCRYEQKQTFWHFLDTFSYKKSPKSIFSKNPKNRFQKRSIELDFFCRK